eukprot:1052698-Rhodomonas_salina.1
MAEHIIDNGIDAFVPNYDPQELESWTSRLDIVTGVASTKLAVKFSRQFCNWNPGANNDSLNEHSNKCGS